MAFNIFAKYNRTITEDIDLSAIDRESKYKNFIGRQDTALTVMLVIFSCFQLYASITNRFPQQIVRYTHLGFAISLAYIMYPATKKTDRNKHSIPDLLLALVFMGVVSYFLYNYKELQLRAGAYEKMDILFAGVGIFLVLLACWRVVGPPIVIISSSFILYGFAGKYLPGFLHHRGYSVNRIITHLFITTEGVIGNPLGVSSTFIFLFICFGAFLEKTGIGQFFIDAATSLAGWAAGGPAKVSVLASALTGTISGSSVSNTVSTGSFTIPMMKKLGYKSEFAAAVEAAASTGGQIMPPVMGSAAFLISDIVGIPYSTLMKHTIVPAILYFTGIWVMVHFEAKKNGLKGLPKDQLAPIWPLLRKKGQLILPLVAIIYFMLAGFTITRSALWGICIAILIPFLRKDTRVPVKQILSALPSAGKSIVSVATACATAGIIVGMVTLTGLGQRIGGGMFELVGGNVLLGLMCAMITSLILGMGVSTTSNYIITSTVAAPILINLGVPLLAAHLFCFYFGIIADITPPVALAAYAGSAIAKSNPFKTGLNAAKIAIGAFIIPYMFALSPKMILIGGTVWDALPMFITAIIGMIGISEGFIGYINGPTKPWWRLIVVAGGLLLIIPGYFTDIVGAVAVFGVMAIHRFILKNHLYHKI
ncbi:MAG: TRAP transporter permease [Treponema sp.]|jgi:TRAP transporter 4TM/12TM fusion protein|nr:TRAP transporter permease [Treponema sp.]